jgi:DNA (cytosine-5)-methyltransferase 1
MGSSKAVKTGSEPDAGIDVADFFCGCGGTSAGLEAAGMTIRLGLDLEPDAACTYRRNFPQAAFVEQDIRNVVPKTVAGLLARGPGRRLLVSACAPCQPYTNFHRKSSGGRPDRTLLLRLVDIIAALEPDYVFVENVPGLHKVPGASTFNRFVAALRRMGYEVTWKVVDCREYGVPQRRRRLVLLACRDGAIAVPAPTHGRADGLLAPATVWDWIGDLPPIDHGETHSSVPNHQASRLTDLNVRRLAATPASGGRDCWPRELRLACHADHEGHSDVYGRMDKHGAAPVLTTKCTSLSNGRYGHPEQLRPISVREAASLQTFPRKFVFVGGIKSATRQVGNAVPVLLAKAMGAAFVAHDRSRDPDRLRPAA